MKAAKDREVPVARPPGVWRNPDFAKLWSADIISQLGTQVTFLGLPLVAIMTLSASPFEAAALRAVEWLPFMLVSLPAGVWVDRRRRRPILIGADLGRALTLLLIPMAFALGALSIWLLYLVAFALGILTVFFDIAYRSYLPAVVERDHLIAGNAALEVSGSAARIAGPGFAGALIALLTPPRALSIDALSFLGSAILLALIRRPEPDPRGRDPAQTPPAARPHMLREIGDGLSYVLGHRILRPFVVESALTNLGLAIVEGILLVYVVRQLGLAAGAVGVVFTVGNVGVLAGAAVANRVADRIGVGRAIVLSSALQGVGLLLVPLAPLAPLPLLIAGQLLRSFGVVVRNVLGRSLRQSLVPAHLQGRTNATLRWVSWGTIPLGNLLGGALATLVGLNLTVWGGALIGLLAIVPFALSPIRTLRDIPISEE
ncbi:MAG: MFS transporter [Chloroflexota bacterium]|nr:MFS transporter [Chloroflexota bacterium]